MSNVYLSLSNEEYQQIIDAVPLIAILVGGSDGNFDQHEKEWAKKIVHIRTFAHDIDLKPIYQELEPVFEKKLSEFIRTLPDNSSARNKIISSKLSGLNVILPKLKIKIASRIYEGYIDFAEQVAKASGGFLRMLAVSEEENEWIGLPMLDPIFNVDEDEEE
ncbi:MAG: hypothetical protein IT267_09305 [Saprospiraceae bacterium]|nr:hypothetical protein [Saprospiraceae bacterium]